MDQVADPYGYLATAELFLATFDNQRAPREKLWNKIREKKGSEFLDSVAEMAIALDFEKSFHVELEKKFAGRNSKDADLFLRVGGAEIWADVTSANPAEAPWLAGAADDSDDGEPSTAFLPAYEERAAAEFVCRKVRHKYGSKFRKAVESGELLGKNLAVLLCIFKAQTDLVAALLPIVGFNIPLLPELWTDCAGLKAVGVFDLRKAENDVLVPLSLLQHKLELRP